MARIAPTLRDLFREKPHDRHMPEYAPGRAELRALLAVAKAARRMASFSIPPRDGQYRGLPGEEARRAAFRALARLDRVSQRWKGK